MNRDEIDRRLERLKGESERITRVLLELEAHQGFQLLKGTPLTGATERAWADISGRMATLWKLFDAYGRVLAEAEELRARHNKPSQVELAELTRLLSGTSVELSSGEIPLEERTLLGPTGEWLSLDGVVQRMNPLYEGTAGLVASVNEVWSALLTSLGEVEEAARAVEALHASLGLHEPEFDRISERLAEARATARSDPMSLASGGRADTSRIEEIGRELAALRGRLEDAVRVRDEHDQRAGDIAATIELVETAEREAVEAQDRVLAKIASPALPELPAYSAALRDRLAALDGLRGEGRWIELATRAGELDRAAATALDQARATTGLITGLLDRREELRGRLDAYKAKAGRLGLAEDTALTDLHQQAHDLLWTSPCDLRRATVALADYQRAIASHSASPKEPKEGTS
ncbi:hypothetical protein [Actinomadura sp. DC4]|uniref:hypothetical protein n=1 Tax=Actinomadura sp. DC4 TaxID=3055069 RepID=UPI0025B0600C|nr:hypothetical protein [Actinomadura sp. DC4]MDN3351376.1 hypothetical protein [Actinomadura sp. DC4]